MAQEQSVLLSIRTRKLIALDKTTHSTITTLTSSRHWKRKGLVVPSQVIQTKATWKLESHSLMVVIEHHSPIPEVSEKARERPRTFTLPVNNCLSGCAVPCWGILPLSLKWYHRVPTGPLTKGHFHLNVNENHSGSENCSPSKNNDLVTSWAAELLNPPSSKRVPSFPATQGFGQCRRFCHKIVPRYPG